MRRSRSAVVIYSGGLWPYLFSINLVLGLWLRSSAPLARRSPNMGGTPSKNGLQTCTALLSFSSYLSVLLRLLPIVCFFSSSTPTSRTQFLKCFIFYRQLEILAPRCTCPHTHTQSSNSRGLHSLPPPSPRVMLSVHC